MRSPALRPALPALILATLFVTAASPPASLPRDVRLFLDRREQCDHWTGEEPYDADRARDIAAAIDDLNCERIERDEAALRKHYARRADIIAALNAGQ